MTIHHATVKKAEKHNILLSEVECEGETMVQALWAKNNYRVLSKDSKEALAAVMLQQTFVAEYPALTLDCVGDRYVVSSTDPENPVEVIAGIDVPHLSDVLDACADFDIDPEEGYADETAHVVVPEKYKAEYAARGNRNHCGDWLAVFLEGRFFNDVGQFDEDAFDGFLRLNDVDMSGKWANLPFSGQRGWQGRYRMNGRQKLEVRVATVGGVHLLDGTFVKAPIEYLEELVDRHPKVNPEWVD